MFDRVVYSSAPDRRTVERDTELSTIHQFVATIRASREYQKGRIPHTVGGILDFIKAHQAQMKRLKREIERLSRASTSSRSGRYGELAKSIGEVIDNPVTGVTSMIPSEKLSKVNEVLGLTSSSLTVAGLFHPISMPLGANLVLSPTSTLMGLAGASALTPLTLALSPMLSALSVSLLAGTNMGLKDIYDRSAYGSDRFYCKCRKCNDSLKFIIDRSDWKIASIGMSAGVIPAPFVMTGYMIRKIRHKVQGNQSKKHRVAQQLYDSASGLMQWRIHTIPSRVRGSKPYRVLSFAEAGCPRAITILCMLMNPLKTAAVMTADSADAVSVIKKTID